MLVDQLVKKLRILAVVSDGIPSAKVFVPFLCTAKQPFDPVHLGGYV